MELIDVLAEAAASERVNASSFGALTDLHELAMAIVLTDKKRRRSEGAQLEDSFTLLRPPPQHAISSRNDPTRTTR